MPVIVMQDGRRLPVNYYQGSKVFAVLNGEEEPSEDQRDFINGVETVEFEALPTRVVSTRIGIEHDDKLEAIIKDKSVYGYDKFLRVKEHISMKYS